MPAMAQNTNPQWPFMKMHGLGNDFVVVDSRASPVPLTEPLIRALADRHRGVGFDQLAVVSTQDDSAIYLTFYNVDGSTSGACGNATRCVARYLMDQTGTTALTLTTARGPLEALDAGDGVTSVNMGPPQLEWQDVPLARALDTLSLPIEGTPTATGRGPRALSCSPRRCRRNPLLRDLAGDLRWRSRMAVSS